MEVKLPLTMIHSAQGAPGYHLNRETPKESKANIDKVWHHHFARIQSEHRQSLASPFCQNPKRTSTKSGITILPESKANIDKVWHHHFAGIMLHLNTQAHHFFFILVCLCFMMSWNLSTHGISL